MSALRVLWAAFVGLYDETIALVGANLAWLLVGVPPVVLLALLLVAFLPAEGEPTIGPLLVAALLLVFLPTPGSVALGDLARVTASREAPTLALFWRALARTWPLGLRLFALSVSGFALLAANFYFYATVASGPAQLLAILWIYAFLFWLGMQVWIVPLAYRISRPRAFDLYRRSAMLTLGHMPFTFALVLVILAFAAASAILLPLYVLAVGSFVALVQAFAFRDLRRRHGELEDEDAELGAA